MNVDLDPCKESHDGKRGVEDVLPVAEEVKVGVISGRMEELVKHVVDGDSSVDVECNAADCNEDDNDIKNIPELF